MLSVLVLCPNVFGVSLECINVINLALGLGMGSVNPAYLSQISTNCCIDYGNYNYVSCDNNGIVVEIVWDRLDLNGYINGSAIPPQLQVLKLHQNAITGTIPRVLASSLERIWLHTNSLTGSIPSNLPNGLIELFLDGNKMSGDVPPLPDSLHFLYLGHPRSDSGQLGNQFTGSISIKEPVKLYIYMNLITKLIITTSSDLTQCDLSHNPILGNYDSLQLSICTIAGIYSANLLPWTLSKILPSTVASKIQSSTKQSKLSSWSMARSNSGTSGTFIIQTESFLVVNSQTNLLAVSTPNIRTILTTDAVELPQNQSKSIVIQFESIVTASSLADDSPIIPMAETQLVENLAFILLIAGAFFAVCLVVVVAGRLTKSPILKSKFARKNSYGTLNTVNSNNK